MTMMGLISQQTPSYRCEDYGRASVPSTVEATFNLADRVVNARRENAMIAAMSSMKKAAKQAKKAPETRQIEAGKIVLDQLDTPKTGRKIAEIILKSENNVLGILKRLEGDGRVIRGAKRKDANGRPIGALWHRLPGYDAPIDPAKVANKAKGNETRKAVLVALEGQMTSAQIAKIIGRSQCHTLEILRFWEALGEVKRTKGVGVADMFERSAA